MMALYADTKEKAILEMREHRITIVRGFTDEQLLDLGKELNARGIDFQIKWLDSLPGHETTADALNALYVDRTYETMTDASIVTAYWRKLGIASVPEGPEDVPLKSLVDFSDYKILFKGRHDYLPAYRLLKEQLQLEGDDYEVITKMLSYFVESLKQKTITFFIGGDQFDNRIHAGIILGAGRGKGQIRRALSQYRRDKYECVFTFSATRVNPEQLIGKILQTGTGKKREETEERGYLNYKGIILDECQDVLAEKESHYEATMQEIRNGSEVYGKNTVYKKLVASNMLSYEPPFRSLFLLHYPNFPPVFFDRGMSRRLFMFHAGDNPIPEEAAWSGLSAKIQVDSLKQYMSRERVQDGLKWNAFATQKLIEFLKEWVGWTLRHPNQRVRAIAEKHFTSTKDLFVRLISILAISKGEEEVSISSVITGGLDAIQFLLCTYEIYANNSQVNLSRDVWHTTSLEEAMLFEWMHHNRALSMEETTLSIAQVQNQIGDIFGVNDRQARGIFGKLVDSGMIGRKQGKNDSKCWLGFTPQIEGSVARTNTQILDLKSFIVMEQQEGEAFEGGKGGNGHPPLSYHVDPSISSSSVIINNKEGGVHSATLATTDTSKNTILANAPPIVTEGNDWETIKGGLKTGLVLGHGFEHAPEQFREALRGMAQVGAIFEAKAGNWKYVDQGDQ